MILTFLSASVPLTKTYTRLPDGTIEKSSYPNVWEVSSTDETVHNLMNFEVAITKHAAQGHCLLKGRVTRPLTCESRKGSTDANGTTDWLCLDIDGIDTHDGTTVDSIMADLGMAHVSYILQWSGSMNIISTALRCHVFVMLTKPISASQIKQWLVQQNHSIAVLRAHQALTKTGNAITWGLDITACQSDKLIYIAPPVLKNIKNPLGRVPRISTIVKTNPTFDMATNIHTIEQNRRLTDERVLELRELAGMPKRKLIYKFVGSHEVLSKPGECNVTGMKQDRGFVYFNLNDGDSWAYYHPEDNPDYIHNFKGEPIYLTKELLPAYWSSLQTATHRTSSTGTTHLAYLDRRTSTYWRGTYNANADLLDIYPAKTESMLRQYADASGLRLGDNIPEWDMEFNPHDNVRVDFTNRSINTFQLSSFMRATPKQIQRCPPTIFKIISHVLGHDVDTIEYFMNWLAYIVQQRERTMTAWIFQGTQGTGKGLLMNRVLTPMFGNTQTVMKRAGELNEKWTDFVVGKFIIFIDEVQTSAYRDEHSIISNLKNLITEPNVMVRMMNKNAYEVPNYASWIFASNKPDPVSVDKEDRRFNVGPYQGTKLKITDAELDQVDTEVQNFYHYLIGYAMDKASATTPLMSGARNYLIELSQSTSESTASALRSGDMAFFLDQLPAGEAWRSLDQLTKNTVEQYRTTLVNVMLRTRPDGTCNIKRDELFTIFEYCVGGMNKSPATFTRFLGHKQITIKPVSLGTKVERGIQTTWLDHAQFTHHMATYFSDVKIGTTP